MERCDYSAACSDVGVHELEADTARQRYRRLLGDRATNSRQLSFSCHRPHPPQQVLCILTDALSIHALPL